MNEGKNDQVDKILTLNELMKVFEEQNGRPPVGREITELQMDIQASTAFDDLDYSEDLGNTLPDSPAFPDNPE